MKNFYPSKLVVDFQAVRIDMAVIVEAIKHSKYPLEVKKSAYIIIRNESANGHSVINGTNPSGVQSDSGLWPDKWTPSIVAVSVKEENRTGKQRGFVVFDTLQSGIDFTCERLQARGLYVGGFAKKIAQMQINSPSNLASAYYKEWVEGEANYHIKEAELEDFVSMYTQASKLFTSNT